MGTDKALLTIDGVRLVDRAARVLSSVCELVIEVGPGLSGLHVVREEPLGGGPLVAIAAAGQELLRLGHRTAALVLAVDLPGVSPALLRLLVAAEADDATVPIADGHPQSLCAVYSAHALQVSEQLVHSGARSMAALLRAISVRRVPPPAWRGVAPPGAFADVDTPQALETARTMILE